MDREKASQEKTAAEIAGKMKPAAEVAEKTETAVMESLEELRIA